MQRIIAMHNVVKFNAWEVLRCGQTQVRVYTIKISLKKENNNWMRNYQAKTTFVCAGG